MVSRQETTAAKHLLHHANKMIAGLGLHPLSYSPAHKGRLHCGGIKSFLLPFFMCKIADIGLTLFHILLRHESVVGREKENWTVRIATADMLHQ